MFSYSRPLCMAGRGNSSLMIDVYQYFDYRKLLKELSQMVSPAVTPKEAERAIHVLESLGLIRKNENGVYERVEALASTGDEIRSMAIVQFQQATLDLAKRSFDAFPMEARDISTLT